MISALSYAGVNGRYFPVNSIEHLSSVLLAERADIVFCADLFLSDCTSTQVNIHSFLEKMRIPFIGSSSDTLKLVLSKSTLKEKWQDYQVNTPDFFVVRREDHKLVKKILLENAVNFPYILKPNCEGNSRGLDTKSIVFDFNSLSDRVDELLITYPEILVEQYLGEEIDIREFTVAMIGNGENRQIFPAEITLKKKKGLRLITTTDKDEHNTLATPVSNQKLKDRLVDFAEKAFNVAGVEDYSRCDILMTNEQLYAIEINGQPMVPDAWFEKCAAGGGFDSEQYIAAIFLAGIERNIQRGYTQLSVPEKMKSILPITFYQFADE